MRAEEYQERRLDVGGWPVNISSYRLDLEWHAKADNVSPGAALARTTGDSREDAERQAIARAGELLARTKRHSV
jgi:hypothetical protein